MIPTLTDHGPFQPQFDLALAAGHLRSYQRARRRSYAERGLCRVAGSHWDFLHLPYDLVSYNLSASEGRLFSYSQQLRFFEAKGSWHSRILSTMCELGMLEEEDRKEILNIVRNETDGLVSQVGGWLARPGGNTRRAAFLPYYCWALQRLLRVTFSYALCRVENGAADFLVRMGGFPMTSSFFSRYFGGMVQPIGFRYAPAVRHEPLVQAAEEQLVERTKLR
ncbi:MAG: hypothetical protein AAF514_21405, partial [Verrucomicrobiota bacterium]